MIVTEMVGHSETTIRCLGCVPEGHACAADGVVPTVLALEFAAQAAAVLLELRRQAEEPESKCPEKGYLASLRAVTLEIPDLPVGRELFADIRLETRVGAMALFSARVTLDGEPVASGRFSVSN